MSKTLDLDVVWGGYYGCKSKDKEEVTLFRIIDFNKDAYHAALFEEDFEEMPSPETVEKLSPVIGHVPMSIDGLFNYTEITLISRAPLTEADLRGYMYYMEHCGLDEEGRTELSEAILGFCSDPPLPLRLSLEDDELQVSLRD